MRCPLEQSETLPTKTLQLFDAQVCLPNATVEGVTTAVLLFKTVEHNLFETFDQSTAVFHRSNRKLRLGLFFSGASIRPRSPA